MVVVGLALLQYNPRKGRVTRVQTSLNKTFAFFNPLSFCFSVLFALQVDPQIDVPEVAAVTEEPSEAPEAKQEPISEDAFWKKLQPVLLLQITHDRSPPVWTTFNPYENPPVDFEYRCVGFCQHTNLFNQSARTGTTCVPNNR